jgi:hypothetical protein
LRTGDEENFPGLEAGAMEQAFIGGYEIHTDAGGFFERKIARFGRDRNSGDDQELGVTAVASITDVAAAAPDFGADEIRRALDDDACEIATGGPWKGCDGHSALDVLDVARIQACGEDLDFGFAGVDRGAGNSSRDRFWRLSAKEEKRRAFMIRS